MSALFKFLNFLSRDRLRNSLAVGVKLPISNVIELLDREGSDTRAKFAARRLKRVMEVLDNDVFRM